MMEQAAFIEDRMIGQIFSIGSERQRMAYLKTLRGNFDIFLSLILQHFSLSSEAVQVTLDLILRRKMIATEVLAAQSSALLSGRYPVLASRLHELTLLRAQIAQKTLVLPGPEGPEAHQRSLAELDTQKEQLEAELARQIPEMNLEQKLRLANRQAVASTLSEGAALVEFVRMEVYNFQAVAAQGQLRWLPSHYIAFVLRAGEPDTVRMIDLGEADLIDVQTARFRVMITGDTEVITVHDIDSLPVQDEQVSSSTETEWAAPARHLTPVPIKHSEGAVFHEGRALRVTVFDPLLPTLTGCTRLFLAPDGDLARLPFEALPTDDSRYLIDDFQISYLGVGRDILRFEVSSTGQPAAPLVVADPDFDLGSTRELASRGESRPGGRISGDLEREVLHFQRLPDTRSEGEQIAAQLGVSPLLGRAAMEMPIKTCHSPHILHIATHGFFLTDQEHDPNQDRPESGIIGMRGSDKLSQLLQKLENPLLHSGLALAGANTWLRGGMLPPEAEDGLLTAEDVSSLDLLDTALVVLSACQTGLGEVHIGEGVFGLRRAFILAGARRLIMSLWKVPDQQTQELMVHFYRLVLDGSSCADALREAQLAMKAKHPHPYYWGAFISQGDPGPLLHVSV